MIKEVPAETLETTPLEFMVATPIEALVQVPLKVEFAKVVVEPIQTEVVPVIALKTGKAFTVKLLALVPVPDGEVTVIVPVVALAGNVAVICVLLFTVNHAETPLKLTFVAVLK